ncbi:MAG: hypothetical protein AAF666_10085, partial [Pseudomonadota bacterium]
MTDSTAPGLVESQEPEKTIYDELPDAPPKKRIRLSIVGKVSVCVVAFWVFLAIFGTWLTPYTERDYIEEDRSGEFFDDPTFMVPSLEVSTYLGTDYTGRDVFSRIVWGARTTIGISFAATLLAYFIGITLGIAAAVAGRWTDAIMSRIVDAILTFPNIMLGLIVIAAFSGQVFINPI